MDSISHPNAAEDRGLRKWFLLALALSLAFHATLAVLFQAKKLEHFQAGPDSPRLVPRAAFKGARVNYPANIFQSDTAPTKPKKITLADKVPAPAPDKPSATLPNNSVLTPRVSETPKLITEEKPNVKASGTPILLKGNNGGSSELADLGKRLTESQAATPSAHSDVAFPNAGGNDAETSGNSQGAGGYTTLNTLLAQAGELKGPVAPVNMPGGALFEYDSAELRPDAIPNLQKLGELITRNPRATFSIEGHTDSFGTPEYNLALSQARAEAVKNWLVTNINLDPTRIQTHGFGSTHLIVPAMKNGRETTKEEQQLNRRVEIVIRTPKK